MIRNYLKIAWRNIVRNKAFSTINILGLGLGIACSLLIMLWVLDERKVDAFHANNQYLYQVYERSYYDGKIDAGYATQGLLAQELKRVIPEISYSSAMEFAAAPGTGNTFEVNDKINKMQGFYAGEDFFKMFSYRLLQGKAQTALVEPNVIAVSENMANLFFGNAENAIGKTIRFDNKQDLKITAVFENIPSASSVKFEFLRCWSDFVKDNGWVNNWGNTSPNTYVQLREGVNKEQVASKIKDFIYRYQQKDKSFIMELGLQPYSERYLYSTFKNGQIDGGRIAYVRLFTLVAIFILLIACINFMNLATARSAERAKEVGLRKVVGAVRGMLIGQFIGEALLITLLSFIIALGLCFLLLPAFNQLTGKEMVLPFMEPLFWVAVLGLLTVTGFVSGSYPALFLSSLNPVKVLKGALRFSWKATFFRKALVVFQFSLSVLLIVAMIVIYRQMEYIQNKNLGYSRENLLYIPIEGDLVKKFSVFKAEALQMPGVTAVSKMRNSPTVIEHHNSSIDWDGKAPSTTVSFADAVVGYDFVKTMKLQLKEGRDFSTAYGADSAAYLLNEEAVRRIGYTNPVGKSVSWGNRKGTVIGVLKDFHFNSMHQSIEPLIARLDENWGWGTILIRIAPGKTKQVLNGLEKICKTVNPKFPFTYQFSDQEFDKLYRSEQMVSKLSNYFAFLAIFISCLGLFGLAMFTAAQRTREIGVRKVLGASAYGIVKLLTSDFLKLVAIAMIVAFPVAWLAMREWLQGFQYKITIDWWIFLLAGAIAVLVALFTVSYQSIRAALLNPVKSLRNE